MSSCTEVDSSELISIKRVRPYSQTCLPFSCLSVTEWSALQFGMLNNDMKPCVHALCADSCPWLAIGEFASLSNGTVGLHPLKKHVQARRLCYSSPDQQRPDIAATIACTATKETYKCIITSTMCCIGRLATAYPGI